MTLFHCHCKRMSWHPSDISGRINLLFLKKLLAKSRETLSHMSKIQEIISLLLSAFPHCDAPDLCKSEQDWGVLKNPQR